MISSNGLHHIEQVLKCSACGCFRPGSISCGSYLCESCTARQCQPYTNQLHRGAPTWDISDLMTTPRSNLKRRKAKQHQCNECGKVYKHLGTLSVHKKMHLGEFNYKCEYCDKVFYLAEYYNRHLRVHTKEKPYQCDVCQKSFSQSNTLTQHKRIHTGEKPYECNICKKNFSVKDYLVKHIRTHTGEKPFECEICGKRYTQRSGLSTHQKSHLHAMAQRNSN